MPVGAKEEKGYFMENLVKSLYQKTTSFSLALVLVLSNFVAMVPLAPQIAGAVSSTITVSPSNLNGWANSASSGASINFVHYSSNVGSGALKFITPSDVNGSARTTKTVDLKLSEVTELTYDSKKEAGSSEAAVAFRLGLDTDGNGSEDLPIVYEPYYNFTAHNPASANAAITSDWQTWDVLNGKFWGPWNPAGGYPTNKTLAELTADFPEARIVRISLGVGTYNADWIVYADNVVVSGQVFDFEADLNPTLDLDTYFVNSSYKGIGVDIEVDELVDATAVEVKVERQNGDPVIKTNKVTGNVLNLLNTGTPTQVTAPIVIQQGTYDEAGSSSWNQPTETWNSTNIPTSITVTISRGAKSPLVKSVNLADISTNLATLSDVMPLDTSAPAISNISIDPRINSNTGGSTVTVYFDMTDETGIDLDASFVMFADGPNTPNQLKESIKVKPVHISGDSYKAEFDSLQFVKANFVGRYNLQFTRVDTLGNRTSSKPVEFRNILVDNSGPTSILITPADGSIVNGIVRFEFEVSDDTGVASGYVKLNGPTTKQANLTHDTGDIWYADIDTSELTDGTYTVDARFVDVFGRARYGANKGSVIVDSTIPTTPTITKPGIRTWHKTAPILNEWTAASDDNGVSHYQIAYNYADGHAFGGGNTCPGVVIPGATGFVACRDVNGLSRNHAPTLTEQGKVTIWVRAIDNAGNAGAWSTPVYYYYDHEAPAADINVSEVANKKFTVSGHAADNEQLNRVYVQLVHRETSTRYGGTTINLIPEGKEADWSVEYNIADLPEGTYAAHVSVVDMAGNTSSAGWTDNFVVDKTKPEVTLLSPADGDFNPATLSIKATDNHHLHRIVANIYDESNSTLIKAACSKFVADADKLEDVMDCSFPALADGTYTLRFNAHDKAGNVASTKTIQLTIDTTSPVIDNLAITKSLTNENSIVLSGTVFDLNLKNYNVRVYNSDKSAQVDPWTGFTGTSNVDNGDLATLNISSLTDGSYWVRIWADDLAGNRTGISPHIYIPFTIDRTAPTITVKDGFVGNKDSKVFSNVSFKLYDQNQIDKYSINGHMVDLSNNVWSDANFNNFKNKLVEGLNTFVLYDVAGNTSTYEFTYDITGPEAPSLVSPTNGAVVKGASLTNEWSAVADAVSYVYESYHDEAATSLRWSESFTSTSKTATNVADTTFWWRVKAIDEAGNVGDWSDLWKVIVDNTAPSVEFTNPTSTTLFNSDVEVRATIADANLRHYWVQVKKNGTAIYSQTILSSGITNEPVYTATEDGDYIVTIAARDLAGGTSTSGNRSEDVVKSFTIDKTAPILTVLAPLANTEFLPTEDIDIETFVGDNRKISSVSIVIEGQAGTFQIDEDFDTDNGGSSFFTIAAGTLPADEYSLIATAIDEAGNITEVYTTLFVVEPEEEAPGEEEGENNEENETDNTDNTDEDGQGGSPQQNNGSSSNNNSGSTANPADNNSATPTNTNNQVAQNTTNNQAPDETGNNDNEEEQSVDTPQDAEDTEGNEENNQDIAGARDEEGQSGMLAWYWWLAILAALAGGWWFIFGRRKKDEEEKQA